MVYATLLHAIQEKNRTLDILLVEDSSFFRDIILSYLRPLNREFAVAEHGTEAIDLLTTLPVPRLVIYDIHMPDMNGIELTRRLRMMPLDYKPHLLMLAAGADGATVQQALEAGANGYLLKLPGRVDFVQRATGILTDQAVSAQ